MAFIKKSFTLIELLVVVVIIGVLAAALIPRLQDAAKRTRDAIRIKDMKVAADALGIYYLEEKKYPLIGLNQNESENQSICVLWSWKYYAWNSWKYCEIFWNDFLWFLVPKYLSAPIKEPSNDRVYSYVVSDIIDWAAFNVFTNRGNFWVNSTNYYIGCYDTPVWTYKQIVQLTYSPEIKTTKDWVRACPNWMPRDISMASSVNDAHMDYRKVYSGTTDFSSRVNAIKDLWYWTATTKPKDVNYYQRGMFLFDGQNFFFWNYDVRHPVHPSWKWDSATQDYICKNMWGC